MHPNIGRDLAFLGELHHMDGAAYRAPCMTCISGLRCEPVHICYLASDLLSMRYARCWRAAGNEERGKRNHFPLPAKSWGGGRISTIIADHHRRDGPKRRV